tara:strand:+ start:673 stop:1152 length:480 start_codon:yes stop_codon:yes gene_type:complete
MNFNFRNNQKSGTAIEKDDRNHILAPPELIESIIHNLSLELAFFNYQNYPIPNDPKMRRATFYFRSHLDKRLIGAFVTLRTFMKRWSTQKQILERFPHLKKAFVSLVFKHCVEEGWFTSHPSHVSEKIKCYQVSELMIKSSIYYHTKYVSSRNKLEFIS